MSADDDIVIIEPTPFTRAEESARGRGLVLKPIPVAIGTLFVILALATAFMFSARAVRFDVTPLPETFAVTDGFAYQLGERYLMLPGDYRVMATLEGYHPLNEIVSIDSEQDQEVLLTMAKLPGILTVTTEPDITAEVYIDQALLGTTPITLDAIEPGLHDISIVSERYMPYDTEIEIEGMRINQSLTASLEPAWAEIEIDSLPPNAAIVVDDNTLGETPASVELLRGRQQIQLQLPGYKVWQTSLSVVAGENQSLPTVRLVRSDGKVSVTTMPAGANVTIGGRYQGQTPLEVALPPGSSYAVSLTKAGYQNVERTINVRPEQDILLSAKLEPVLGVIRLLVEPKGGELFVDGVSMGEPSRRLQLTASNHDIEIIKEGYAPYQAVVTPRPGLAQQLLVRLQTEDEAKVAAISEQVAGSLGIEFKLIIGDKLSMGAGRREPGRRSNEIEKEVQLTRPYYLSAHEITNEQYMRFDASHNSGVLGRMVLTDSNRPVVNISWDSAVRFCNWLSAQDNLPPAYEQKSGRWRAVSPMTTGYRLPTEAEWAWAARYAAGPEPTRFPWGNAMPPTVVEANYADVTAQSMVPYYIADYNDTYRGPAPVGSYAPNEFGIFDLAGNVSEWIHDFYSIALSDGLLVDPMGPESGEHHVVRGSNYTHGRFSELRWTFRDYGKDPRPDVGFRIARFVD